jgi:hypothetical protein
MKGTVCDLQVLRVVTIAWRLTSRNENVTSSNPGYGELNITELNQPMDKLDVWPNLT